MHFKSSLNSLKFLFCATFLLACLNSRLVAQDLPFSQIDDPGSQVINYLSGEYGARFINTSGEAVTITQLGRWVRPGNSQQHTLRIYDSAGTVLGTVTVNLSGAPANQFTYGTLSTPVVLAARGIVFIFSTETAGAETLHGPSGMVNRTEDIGTIEMAYMHPVNGVTAQGNTGATYGPVTFKFSTPVRTWTKSGTTYRTDGSYYQTSSAINAAAPGEVVLVPAGTYTWGASGDTLSVKDGVTLTGEAPGTIINMDPGSPTGFGNSLIVLGNGSTIRTMTFNGPDAVNCPLIRTGGNDWRVSGIVYTQFPGRFSYFMNIQTSARGLIDGCVITGGAGNSELIFARGVDDAWDSDSTIGGPQNIFVEDCLFKGEGYVCDANSNARLVVRNTQIEGGIKVDGHGVWSNSVPVRGVRHMEIYRNHWSYTNPAWTAIEMRGGTGMVWGNTSDLPTATNGAWFYLTEYGVFNNNGAFTPNYQTADDYPIRDQIGRGRYATPGDFATATSEPMYLWNNLKGGNPWPFDFKAIVAGSIDRYREQTANPTATFGWEDIIQADRDYFRQVVGFDGSTGVGVGTKAQMLAITPTKAGVGFWVTDEGSWDTTLPENTSGQLYTWNGSAWILKYTPYTYPHPARRPAAPQQFELNSPSV